MAELVDDVVGGRYAAGSALPNEADLGARFGVSRTVVRESVKLLQDRGLVRSHQGVGTVVREFDAWDLIDDDVLSALVRHDESRAILDELVAVRAGLERDMAAATAGSGTDVAEVRAAYERMAALREDPIAFGLADVAFHDAVMRLSGNRLGRVIVNRIHDKARTTERYHGAVTPEAVTRTLAEHAAVLAALEAADADAAGTAMHAHITGSWARRRPAQTLRDIRRSAAPSSDAGG
ncbi:FadR/GntR family transcriptional regulator [Nocardioides mangrovi]|uniref:FCD domain-containing protein n=1 Tax=Nocardioides mangrovi TaxID=2874580 RepID=A0ABS7UJC6_9ACTN|nr:FCD domain-containing protein [Nocardioides mangrovi]MBZ5740969.1 FCD domain-containing protein [Nocardioides mangrovi]